MTNKRKPFSWANSISKNFLNRDYLLEGQSLSDRVRKIGDHAEKLQNIKGLSDKFYKYMSLGYYSLSSPAWTNFGTDRGTPVACFGSTVDDSVPSILNTVSEIGMMSKLGGGTAVHLKNLRPRGYSIKNNGKSTGPVHFLQLFQSATDVISQGSTRRGATSAYIPIDHPDYREFLTIGTEGSPLQRIHKAVVIPEGWMESMLSGDKEKAKLFGETLRARAENSTPYIMFADNANANTVDVYSDKNIKIEHSQLCSEIMLPSSTKESFVCVLASMNLVHVDEWKDTDAVETLVYVMDAFITDFLNTIDKMSEDNPEVYNLMERAYTFAKNHRALGLGVLGWHSLLQSKMLSFESKEAAKLNLDIFKLIKKKSYAASEYLAEILGEPPMLTGYGRRNATLNAIAPTLSSSIILNQVSPSIEPRFSNYFLSDSAKAAFPLKNPYLKKLLKSKGHDTDEVWKNIKDNDGSVYNLPDDILSIEEKEVFKTFAEIDQYSIIFQASVRQNYIDQAQSLNLNIVPDIENPNKTSKYIADLHITAWTAGIKTLYYMHSVNQSQQFAKKKRLEVEKEDTKAYTCAACEG